MGFSTFILGLVIGYMLGLYFASRKNNPEQEEEVNTSSMDGEQQYYVQLPFTAEIRKILIEEPLELEHLVTLDNVTYKVIRVNHTENKHTIFILIII